MGQEYLRISSCHFNLKNNKTAFTHICSGEFLSDLVCTSYPTIALFYLDADLFSNSNLYGLLI